MFMWRGQQGDAYVWRCKTCRAQKSISTSSYFEGSNLSLVTIIQFICYWAFDTPLNQISYHLRLGGTHNAVNWANCYREVCGTWLANHPPVIGGLHEDGTLIIVEVKESKDCRRKYHRVNGHLIVTEGVPGLELLPNYEVQQVAVDAEHAAQEQQVAGEEVVMDAEEVVDEGSKRTIHEVPTEQHNTEATATDPMSETFFAKVMRNSLPGSEEAGGSNTVHLMIAAESQTSVPKESPFQPNVLRRGRKPKKKDGTENAGKSDGDKPVFECEYCQRTFSTPSQLTTHSWTHTKPYTCSDCQARFSTKGNLIVHRRRHSGEKPLSCPKCDARFSIKGNLKRHLKSHTGEKPWQCTQCGSRFTEKKSLKVHMRRHTGERPYQCTLCLKAFSQTSILQSHMAMHLNQREHLCNQCGKSFRQKSQLRLHEQRHAGLRKYQCSVCPYKFLKKGDMERHKRIHTGERPYVCEECGKTFTRQQSLNEHMNRHWGVKPYKCKYCKKGFVEMSACYKHVKVHERTKAEADQSKSEARGQNCIAKQPVANSGKYTLVANQGTPHTQIQSQLNVTNGGGNRENSGVTTFVIQKLRKTTELLSGPKSYTITSDAMLKTRLLNSGEVETVLTPDALSSVHPDHQSIDFTAINLLASASTFQQENF